MIGLLNFIAIVSILLMYEIYGIEGGKYIGFHFKYFKN